MRDGSSQKRGASRRGAIYPLQNRFARWSLQRTSAAIAASGFVPISRPPPLASHERFTNVNGVRTCCTTGTQHLSSRIVKPRPSGLKAYRTKSALQSQCACPKLESPVKTDRSQTRSRGTTFKMGQCTGDDNSGCQRCPASTTSEAPSTLQPGHTSPSVTEFTAKLSTGRLGAELGAKS